MGMVSVQIFFSKPVADWSPLAELVLPSVNAATLYVSEAAQSYIHYERRSYRHRR